MGRYMIDIYVICAQSSVLNKISSKHISSINVKLTLNPSTVKLITIIQRISSINVKNLVSL